jgi:protein tyrosine phosphatase (PTP) superfamily phosphohydrolase (DUF442 family)
MPENETQRKTATNRFGLKVLISLMILTGIGYYVIFFVINANFREVVPDKVYRSAQPTPGHLKKWVRRYGIKTVINLRGSSEKEIEQEQSTADELGVKFVSIPLSSRRLATASELSELIIALENAETPFLLHCKAGVDRAGTACALAAMVIGNVDYNKAKWQAYVAPGPWKRKDFSKRRPDYIHNYAHISDFFKLYESYCRRQRVDTNNWQRLRRWAIEMEPSEDNNIEYKFTCSYFPLFGEGKRFFPVWKITRDAYIQFIAELLIISFLVIFICHKLSGNKSPAHNGGG